MDGIPGWCAGVLICPVCGDPLVGDGRTLRCPRGHSFDRAREGYYHLLPAGHGRSKIRGDTREMVRARRRFLERGHYEPLLRAIQERVSREIEGRVPREVQARVSPDVGEHGSGEIETRVSREAPEPVSPEIQAPVSPERVPTIVEAGCGEGYYIGGLARALGAPCCFIGVDVSKDAVRLAARAHREVCFLVNDIKHRITVADRGVDVLLDVFAPRNPGEFARIVREGGLLMVAIPQDDHLRELRERLPLLGIEPGKRDRTVEQFADAFRPESEEAVEYRRELGPEEVLDLVGMSPSAWHVGEELRAEVEALGRATVTVSVLVMGFRRVAQRGGAGSRG